MRINPWKHLVIVTLDMLDHAGFSVGDESLPSYVLRLGRELTFVRQRAVQLQNECEALSAEVERLTPKREPAPLPPDYNALTIQKVRKQEARRGK